MRDEKGHTHLGKGKITKSLFGKKGMGAERYAKSEGCNRCTEWLVGAKLCIVGLLGHRALLPSPSLLTSLAGSRTYPALADRGEVYYSTRSILHFSTALQTPIRI